METACKKDLYYILYVFEIFLTMYRMWNVIDKLINVYSNILCILCRKKKKRTNIIITFKRHTMGTTHLSMAYPTQFNCLQLS